MLDPISPAPLVRNAAATLSFLVAIGLLTRRRHSRRRNRIRAQQRPHVCESLGLGFRNILAFFTRAIAHRGLDLEVVGPYRRQRTTATRLSPRGPSALFRTIHL